MVTNQMTHEAAMAVSIIDQIKGNEVEATKVGTSNKIVISQNNRIIAQWTGDKWILGTMLQSVLPIYEENSIHVSNACTRLHTRAISFRESKMNQASTDHSLRMIRHHMDELKVNSLDFSGSVANNWSPSVIYRLVRKSTVAEVKQPKQMFQLLKVIKATGVISKVDYGFGTSLIGWIDLKDNRVVMASNFISYINKWSLNGTKEIVKDDVLRQIAEFNNTKKR